MTEVPLTWVSYRNALKKDPRGLRTWFFAIHKGYKETSKVVSFKGNFPKAAEYAREAAKRVAGATEIVVLIP